MLVCKVSIKIVYYCMVKMNFISDNLIEFSQKHPILLGSNIILSWTFPIDDVLVPYFIGQVIDQVQRGSDRWLTTLITLVCIVVGMQVIYVVSSFQDSVIIPKLQNFIRHNMTSDLVERHALGNANEFVIGDVLSRLVRIPLTTVILYEQFKNYIIPLSISFCITSYLIYKKDKIMGITLFCSAFALYVCLLISPSSCSSQAHDIDSQHAIIDEATEDILQNIPVVFVANKTTDELSQLSKLEARFEKAYSRSNNCIVKQRAIALIPITIMLGIFIYRSYHGLRTKTLNTGAFVMIFTIIMQWFATLGYLTAHMKDLVIDIGVLQGYDRLRSNYGTNSGTDVNTNGMLPTHIPTTGLHIINISYYAINKDSPILHDFTLHVKAKERIALIGEIGSGKSTLLKIIVGLKHPTSGAIYIDGTKTTPKNISMMRKRIGYVQQNPVLFNRSVFENITYGIKDVTLQDVDATLNKLGLTEAFSTLKDGLSTRVGKHGSNLSGGQRQLVQCIRVFLQKPDILLLDEITSSIDASSKEKLFAILDDMMRDKITIMVTHDKDMLRLATRIVKMEVNRTK